MASLDLLADSIDGVDDRAEGDEEELLPEADAQREAAVSSALQASDDDWQLLGPTTIWRIRPRRSECPCLSA